MAAATAQQSQQIDAAVAELRRQYRAGLARVEANAGGFFPSSEQQAIRKSYLDMGVLLEQWASTYRRWALAGRRDDGSEYTVERFLDFGRNDLADAVQKISAEAYDRSLFAAVKAAAGSIVTPGAWPSWVKWTAGALALAAVTVIAVNLARAAK
ncbi:hypothetical protein JRI60_26875 [Archangium violaceum]|uniref:hypothetical protein n=1 Tax=Archangium violaceum TaxID=83451 RepID=UPI001951FF39|nr:hypothetical protein [Archangium violaceum]QRN92836.1 hypothetical protein JRI60_26875 [Archangium violaceum]